MTQPPAGYGERPGRHAVGRAGVPPGYDPARPRSPAGAPEGRRSPTAGECWLCGSGPAIKATLRRHTGMVVLMRFGSMPGPFCRDCGITSFRAMTGHTLLAGWWGVISFFVTPVVLAINLVHRIRMADLPRPTRDPAVIAPLPAPLDPGRPLYRRPAILGLAVPVVALVAIAYAVAAAAAAPDPDIGRCVGSSEYETAELVPCGGEHDGKVVAVTEDEDGCPPETTFVIYAEDGSGRYLCVAPE